MWWWRFVCIIAVSRALFLLEAQPPARPVAACWTSSGRTASTWRRRPPPGTRVQLREPWKAETRNVDPPPSRSSRITRRTGVSCGETAWVCLLAADRIIKKIRAALIISASLSISIARGALMVQNIRLAHLSVRKSELWQNGLLIRIPFGVVRGVGRGMGVLDGW